MLYEVITRSDVGRRHHRRAKGADWVCRSTSDRANDQAATAGSVSTRGILTRITSYNVCYTKLLREIKADDDGIVTAGWELRSFLGCPFEVDMLDCDVWEMTLLCNGG